MLFSKLKFSLHHLHLIKNTLVAILRPHHGIHARQLQTPLGNTNLRHTHAKAMTVQQHKLLTITDHSEIVTGLKSGSIQLVPSDTFGIPRLNVQSLKDVRFLQAVLFTCKVRNSESGRHLGTSNIRTQAFKWGMRQSRAHLVNLQYVALKRMRCGYVCGCKNRDPRPPLMVSLLTSKICIS